MIPFDIGISFYLAVIFFILLGVGIHLVSKLTFGNSGERWMMYILEGVVWGGVIFMVASIAFSQPFTTDITACKHVCDRDGCTVLDENGITHEIFGGNGKELLFVEDGDQVTVTYLSGLLPEIQKQLGVVDPIYKITPKTKTIGCNKTSCVGG